MSKHQRCNYKINVNHKKNVNHKMRKCKRFASINGKCTQHYKKNIFDIEKQDFGICCFCSDYCNPCSQSCGKCSRML